MDIICTHCGEPWEMDYVLHDAPEEFKRKGGVITHCPSCPKDGSKPKLDEKTEIKLEAAKEIGELLGDDIDGVAAMLEDFGLV
jgi:hypothetical protein